MADNWKVLPQGQRQTTQLNPGGTGFTTGWEVTFQVTDGPGTGITGQVFVPSAQYTPETVHAAIQAAVTQIQAVASL